MIKLVIMITWLWHAFAVDKYGVIVETLAGSGSYGNANGVGYSASFELPTQIVSNSDGSLLYIIDNGNNEIRSIVTETANVTTLAGTGVNGVCSSANFNGPKGGALDSTVGKLYVTDHGNNVIRVLSISPCNVSTFAGSGTAGNVDGVGTAAQFNQPWGIVIDIEAQLLYVTEPNHYVIRRINITSKAVTTIVGAYNTPGSSDGIGTAARLNYPYYMALDTVNQYLYVTCLGSNTIRRIHLTNYNVTTIAGSGANGYSDGIGTLGVKFYALAGLALDALRQVLYIGDQGNYVIRAIDLSNMNVTTFAGRYNHEGFKDGNTSVALLDIGSGTLTVSVDYSTLYWADYANLRIRFANLVPLTSSPTYFPTAVSSQSPTGQPTDRPTTQPHSSVPTAVPTVVPSHAPTGQPTDRPTSQPHSSVPTAVPTVVPSQAPTGQPTDRPTTQPSGLPSVAPTNSSHDEGGGLSSAGMGAIISVPVAVVLLSIVYALNMTNGITNALAGNSSVVGTNIADSTIDYNNANSSAAADIGLKMTSNA